MSSGPSYTNRAPGADDGAPPPYMPSQVSMPTPAIDTTNQQAATTLDTGYQPSPRMPVPQTHTTTPKNVSSSSYSASPSSKYGAGSSSQTAPAPPPQRISSTTNYYYQAPPPAAMYVPIVTDPPTQVYLNADCARGRHRRATRYGVCGILAAIFLFPFGLICLCMDKDVYCSRCGARMV